MKCTLMSQEWPRREAVAYIRARDGADLDTLAYLVTAWSRERGIELVWAYLDDDDGHLPLDGLRRLMGHVGEGVLSGRTLILQSFDTLSMDPSLVLMLLEQCKRHGVLVFAIEDMPEELLHGEAEH